MARRTYAVADVLATACELAAIEEAQMMAATEEPAWAYMAREAVAGVIYELCEIRYPDIAKMFGHTHHTTALNQVKRFRERWPRQMRRNWIESVLVKLDGHEVHEQIRRTLGAAEDRYAQDTKGKR